MDGEGKREYLIFGSRESRYDENVDMDMANEYKLEVVRCHRAATITVSLAELFYCQHQQSAPSAAGPNSSAPARAAQSTISPRSCSIVRELHFFRFVALLQDSFRCILLSNLTDLPMRLKSNQVVIKCTTFAFFLTRSLTVDL